MNKTKAALREALKEAVDGYKTGLLGGSLDFVSEAFDLGWSIGNQEWQKAREVDRGTPAEPPAPAEPLTDETMISLRDRLQKMQAAGDVWITTAGVLTMIDLALAEPPAPAEPLTREIDEGQMAKLHERGRVAWAAPAGPMKLGIIRKWPEGFSDRLDDVWRDLVGFTPDYKLFDLQSVLAEYGFELSITEAAAKKGTP